MFEQTVLPGYGATRRGWMFLVSTGCQGLVLGFLLLLPLVFPDAMPMQRLAAALTEPSAPPPPPTAGVRDAVKLVKVPRSLADTLERLWAPVRIPRELTVFDDPGPAIEACTGCVDGSLGTPGGVQEGVIGEIAELSRRFAPAPPPPPPAEIVKTVEPPKQSAPVPVSGGVQAAKLVRRVMPVYPPLARQARIQGVVNLQGIIGRDGRIRELRLVSGHPLLAPAALEAVRQWLYAPTLLSGVPVEVIAPIEVRFILSQ